jgi:hypothetical protein
MDWSAWRTDISANSLGLGFMDWFIGGEVSREALNRILRPRSLISKPTAYTFVVLTISKIFRLLCRLNKMVIPAITKRLIFKSRE